MTTRRVLVVAVGELLLRLLATIPAYGASANGAGRIRVSAECAGTWTNYPSRASVELGVSRGPSRAPHPGRSGSVSLQ